MGFARRIQTVLLWTAADVWPAWPASHLSMLQRGVYPQSYCESLERIERLRTAHPDPKRTSGCRDAFPTGNTTCRAFPSDRHGPLVDMLL